LRVAIHWRPCHRRGAHPWVKGLRGATKRPLHLRVGLGRKGMALGRISWRGAALHGWRRSPWHLEVWWPLELRWWLAGIRKLP